jgi:hypothetical protein
MLDHMPAASAPLPVALLREVVLQPDESRIEIALSRGARGLVYRLECLRGAALLVRYENETARGHVRTVAGRAAPYQFRSVEQLRYDFERDVQAALR